MKPPYGHCPECGSAGVSMNPDGGISCPSGHLYTVPSSTTLKVAAGGSNQPGEKKSPPTAMASGGSGFKKRAGNNTQTAEDANNRAGSPATPAFVSSISVHPSELELESTSSGVVQDSPNFAPTARNISISDFIHQAKELDENVAAHRSALKHILKTLDDLREEVEIILGTPESEEG